MHPNTLIFFPAALLNYRSIVLRVFLLTLIVVGLSACGGGGDADSPINNIGDSGLSVDNTSLNLTLDQDGARTHGGITASWTSLIVTDINVAAPPGATQPSWLDFGFVGRNSPLKIEIGLSSSSLPLGIYTTTLRVTAFNVKTAMDFVDINVRIEVVEKPQASPTSLTFDMVQGILPLPQTVTLSRPNSTVSISDSTSIVFNKGSDYSIQNESVEVNLNSIAQMLAPGVYNSSLEIDYNGGRWSIPITFNVFDSANYFAVAMAINPDTPLAGELHVNSGTIPTRVSVEISDNTNTWTIDDNTLSNDHLIPIVGFRPDRLHTLTVSAVNDLGEPVTLGEVLSITTPALPAAFPKLTVSSDPTMMEAGYTLFNVIPQKPDDPFGSAIVIVDNIGEVVWYHRGPRFFDVRQIANGNILFMQSGKVYEIDMLGNQINSWSGITEKNSRTLAADANNFHHEIFPMDNGNFLVLSAESRKNVPNYPVSLDPDNTATESATVVGDVIVEFDPSGKLVNEWRLFDMLDPYRLGYDSLGSYWKGTFGVSSRDWSHANAVIYDSSDDSIIVSIRHLDTILKFNRTPGTENCIKTSTCTGTATDKIKWILAPNVGWTDTFTPYLLTPTNDQTYFSTYHQHAPEVLANGNILVYDNGSFRSYPSISFPVDQKTFSRAVEYSIDETTTQATLVWEYGAKNEGQPGWNYSGALGDANLLPTTNNVLITHGSMFDSNNNSWARIVEVTHNVGNTSPETEVFEMKVESSQEGFGSGWRVYRSTRIKSF